MSRKNAPFTLGQYWLDKRSDGKAAEIWQITSYNSKTRSNYYISTNCADVGSAIEAMKVFYLDLERQHLNPDGDVPVALLIMQYAEEHAVNAISASSLCANMRLFLGFLLQDKVGIGALVHDLNPQVLERFRRWRMGPHSYELNWQGKPYSRSSPGVKGETVSKNLDDVRSALNYAVAMGRIRDAPRIPRLAREYRSPPRDRVLSSDELGAMIGYASFDPPLLRWILLLLATAMRPEAALKLNVSQQYNADTRLLDLHPVGAPRTRKRNPVVPVTPEFHAWLVASKGNFVTEGDVQIHSMKRRWRTMRRELEFGPEVVAKTIRHTVATRLRSYGVLIDQIAGLLGHQESNRMTAVYAKYDPNHLGDAKVGLSRIWNDALKHADEWRRRYYRDTQTNANCVIHQRDSGDATPVRPIDAEICG